MGRSSTVLFRTAWGGGGKTFFVVRDNLRCFTNQLPCVIRHRPGRLSAPWTLQPINARVAHARTARKTEGMGPLATFSPAGTYGYIIVHATAALTSHSHQSPASG
jgi:hypothetical protein